MTDSIAGDGRNYEVRNPEKLASLKNSALKKADDEREALLESARRESSAWLEEQNAALDRMVEQIHTEAVKRAEEISKRQISGAEMARPKARLRLQNSLLDEAVTMLQKELTALRIHPSYPGVLAGLAFEAAEKLPAGTEVRIQLASEDEALGRRWRRASGRSGRIFPFPSTPTAPPSWVESGSPLPTARGAPPPTGGKSSLK
jgi:vacuolar-type H+-ATPase subunit E/Vma4